MSILVESSNTSQLDSSYSLSSFPLPRRSRGPPPLRRYEVTVVGGGPSGLFLSLLLSRAGLSSSSLLCIDAKSGPTRTGHADGINARPLEMLATLGLYDEVHRLGTSVAEMVFWTQTGQKEGLVKTQQVPFFFSPARFEQNIALHQGHMERIFSDGLQKSGHEGARYGTKLVSFEMDEGGDPEFPVRAVIESEGKREMIRTKYLVGADGARSVVREAMGVKMEGDVTDALWGVIDLVVDTDFPDIRRQAGFYASSTASVRSAFVVPREKLPSGDYLTRLYVDMSVKTDGENGHVNGEVNGFDAEDQRKKTREARKNTTAEMILRKVRDIFHPYRFEVKAGTEIDWWAAYGIGQRVAERFSMKDSGGEPRVFIVGDACHTHSPSQGQGMNVSIQDSYNLSWKLIWSLFGLASDNTALLDSYEAERHPNACDLIRLDKRYHDPTVSWEEKTSDMRQFALSCGIEYAPNILVERDTKVETRPRDDYLNGLLRSGRRLFDVKVQRFADGVQRSIHEDFHSDARCTILVLCSTDLPDSEGVSYKALDEICGRLLGKFPKGLLTPVVLQPMTSGSLQWTNFPTCVKEKAEMRMYNATQEAYEVYGVEREKGAIVVVRPDGIIGLVSALDEVAKVDKFLSRVLRNA